MAYEEQDYLALFTIIINIILCIKYKNNVYTYYV